MHSGKMQSLFRTTLVAAVVLAAGSGSAQAARVSSGPLWVGDSEYYTCAAANVGSTDIAVEVLVTINGGGFGAKETCDLLGPKSVCDVENSGGPNFRYCTITTSGKRATRGTFCNRTRGICVPVQ